MLSSENTPLLMSEAADHHLAGRMEEAEALYRRVLESDPDHADALHALGILCHQSGDQKTALDLIKKAVEIKPKAMDFLTNLGLIHQSCGNGEEAIACFRQALEQAPDFTVAHLALANALEDRGQQEEAIACLKTLVSVAPDFPQGQFNLGFAMKGTNQGQEAEVALKRGLALKPDYAEAWNVLGEIQRDRGGLEAALLSFRQALELKSDLSAAHMNFATLLRDMGRLMDAEAAFSQALQSNPNDASLHNGLGLLMMLEGRMAESGAACGRALEIAPDYGVARSNLLLSLNYDTQDAAAVFAAHLEYGAVHGVPADILATTAIHNNDRDPKRKLRIGYVSSDLRRHSVSCFLEPLLVSHDPVRMEVTCYAEVMQPDEVTHRLQGLVPHWRSTVGMSDEALAQQVCEDGIDILVDLNGHTAGNRLPMFARKPAPVQVTWLGYPNTTGLSAMTYRICDTITDPQGAEAFMSETPLRLPGCFLCYEPPHAALEEVAPPFTEHDTENGPVTFGSFNNFSKLGEDVAVAWSRVLVAVPGSRLYLKCAQLSDKEMCGWVEKMFAGHGIARERLKLAGYAARLEDHLGAYGKMSIALDPFPYNGTTTTCEALWMGVPVITRRGAHHGGRVGASLLDAMGLGELVAEDEDAYVALAVELAADKERLGALRASLQQRMKASPLTDGAAFAARMESAYRRIWKAWCEGDGKME